MANLRGGMIKKPISLNLRNFQKRVGERFEWTEFEVTRISGLFSNWWFKRGLLLDDTLLASIWLVESAHLSASTWKPSSALARI